MGYHDLSDSSLKSDLIEAAEFAVQALGVRTAPSHPHPVSPARPAREDGDLSTRSNAPPPVAVGPHPTTGIYSQTWSCPFQWPGS